MAYLKTAYNVEELIGKTVRLTQEKESCVGKFTVGSIVTITEVCPIRGYTFQDEEGNMVIEAGFGGFDVI